MTITVNIHEAKTQFYQLLRRALNGEEVIIARDGQPIARLVPIGYTGEPRPEPGIDRDRVTIQPDFDERLDEFEER